MPRDEQVLAQQEREQERFHKGTYKIALGSYDHSKTGQDTVEGDILGNYGVHKEKPQRWNVTYIPLGMKIDSFRTRTGARIVARFWYVEVGDRDPTSMPLVAQVHKLQFRKPRFDSMGVPAGYDMQGRLIEGEA